MAKALRRADALVLATDPDRKGEAIAWQVPSWLRKQDAVGDRAVHQVAVHEVTRAGVPGRRVTRHVASRYRLNPITIRSQIEPE